ncbi:hypothetical protein DPEC_G00266290 [Dallia pectoralis]|uniref:Uncharacterized protein n=1 Tax=Dallia pectoralis TaxID=75939 RepID=A0ACC2FNA5_DALPE|nr:hypothetical protein DPEC_G00266290 [Dallia pectoralis]
MDVSVGIHPSPSPPVNWQYLLSASKMNAAARPDRGGQLDKNARSHRRDNSQGFGCKLQELHMRWSHNAIFPGTPDAVNKGVREGWGVGVVYSQITSR